MAETLNMSEAAKKLYISQPTVSQMISDLEIEYQATLFERHPKQLKITPIGKLFFERALDVVTSYENLNQFMSNTNIIRPLKIGATLTVGNTMISDIVSQTQMLYPDIDCSVYVENTEILEHRLLHNELDIALVEGIINNEKIFTEPVIDDSLVLICGNEHPFAKMNSVRYRDLHNQDFILRETGSGTRALFEQFLQKHHIPYQVKWECNSGTAIIDAVCHNLGISALSYRCVKYQVEHHLLHACTMEGMPLHRYFYLCYNQCHPFNSQMTDFAHVVKSM